MEQQGTLLTHCGARRVSRADLAMIEAPAPTATWKPIKHADLVESLTQALGARGLAVVEEQFAVQRDGRLVFGVFDLTRHAGDFRAALGLRAANDKTMPIQITVGLRVFVCDNLAFRGDLIALTRKHTAGLDLPRELARAVERFERHVSQFEREVEAFKALPLSDERAKSLIHDAFARRLLPLRLLPAVSHEYFEPSHPEFAPRTLWSLSNAFTEVAKPLPEPVKFRALLRLGQLFSAVLN